MDISLKPELAKFVAEKIRAGQFTDASDVVNEALEVLKEQEEFSPEHEAYLRRELQKGIDQLNQGQHADFDAEKIITEERKRIGGGKGHD
jgi:antitoxin ParD1/3/4